MGWPSQIDECLLLLPFLLSEAGSDFRSELSANKSSVSQTSHSCRDVRNRQRESAKDVGRASQPLWRADRQTARWTDSLSWPYLVCEFDTDPIHSNPPGVTSTLWVYVWRHSGRPLVQNTNCVRACVWESDLGGATEVETQSCCIFSQTAKSMQSGFEWKKCTRLSGVCARLADPDGNPRRQSAVSHYSSSVSATTISDNVAVAVATNTLVPLHLHWERNGGSASERQSERSTFSFFSLLLSARAFRHIRGHSATSAGRHGVQ